MPTYEYQCSGCQHEFELYQSFSASPVTLCPECKLEKIEKKISGGAGIVFKGGGFYETDYKRGKGSEYHTKSEGENGKKPSAESPKSDSANSPTPAAASSSSTEPKKSVSDNKSSVSAPKTSSSKAE
jgi:putative FmdB family regulatory protein